MTTNALSSYAGMPLRRGLAFQDFLQVETIRSQAKTATGLPPLAQAPGDYALRLPAGSQESGSTRFLPATFGTAAWLLAGCNGNASQYDSALTEHHNAPDTAVPTDSAVLADTGVSLDTAPVNAEICTTLVDSDAPASADEQLLRAELGHLAIGLGLDAGVFIGMRRLQSWLNHKSFKGKAAMKTVASTAEMAVYAGGLIREFSHWIKVNPELLESEWTHTAGLVALELGIFMGARKVKQLIKSHPIFKNKEYLQIGIYGVEGALLASGLCYGLYEWDLFDPIDFFSQYGTNMLKSAGVVLGGIATFEWLKALKTDLKFIQEQITKFQKVLNPNISKADRYISGLQGLTIATGALLALTALGVDVPDIVLSLGLTGLGLGMAFKDLLGSGVSYLVTKSLNSIPEDDFIEVGGAKGHVRSHDPIWLKLQYIMQNGVRKFTKVPGSALLGTSITTPFGNEDLIKQVQVGDYVRQVGDSGILLGQVTEINAEEEYFVMEIWDDNLQDYAPQVIYLAYVNEYTHKNFKKEIPPLPKPLMEAIVNGVVVEIADSKGKIKDYSLSHVRLEEATGKIIFIPRAALKIGFAIAPAAPDKPALA